jgi:hypothetical protein
MKKFEQAAAETVASAIATSQPKPVLLLTWSLHPTTGKPVSRWIVEAPVLAVARAV